jgi:hypothetical protein
LLPIVNGRGDSATITGQTSQSFIVATEPAGPATGASSRPPSAGGAPVAGIGRILLSGGLAGCGFGAVFVCGCVPAGLLSAGFAGAGAGACGAAAFSCWMRVRARLAKRPLG